MASTATTRNRLNQQGTGDNTGTWGAVLNSQALALVDEAMDGVTSVAISGNVTLTSINYATDQARRRVLKLTGAPGATYIVTIPSVEKVYHVINQTNAAQIVRAGGLGVTIPAAVMTTVVCDGTDCFAPAQTVTAAIGTVCDFAGTTAPSGWLLCYGQAISRAAYAALFGVIGTLYGSGDGSTTFNVPDLRGRVIAGADNMGGSAAGRLTGYTTATAGGSQTYTQTTANMPSHAHGVNDFGHGHGVSDPGHTHTSDYPTTINAGAGAGVVANATITQARTTSTSTTGITIAAGSANVTIQNTGSGTPHTLVQPTAALNKIIYAGV